MSSNSGDSYFNNSTCRLTYFHGKKCISLFKFYLENCVFNEILVKFGCISDGSMLKQVPKREHHIIFKIVTWYVKV